MKFIYISKEIQRPFVALMISTTMCHAGSETIMSSPAPGPDVISGVLKLDLNTHFICYGNDTWGDENPNIDELNFNPSLELSFALPVNLKATVGTWWDVNDKGGGSSLGGNLQEVDVWTGLTYTYNKFSIGMVGQAWLYGSSTEKIVDVNLSYDCFLKPTLIMHNRVGEGASGGDDGTVIVGGISYGFDAGPVSLSIPLNLAYFATDNFYGNGGDTGVGYASIGFAGSLPLSPYLGIAYGNWTLNGGFTYYFTNHDITVNNPEDNFLTANLGLSVAF